MASPTPRIPLPEGRAWILNRLVYRSFTTPWLWMLVGAFVGGSGAIIALAAPFQFHPIPGAIARYSFDAGELRLVGNKTSYSFRPDNFRPALPKQIPSGTSVVIWINRSYPDIDALEHRSGNRKHRRLGTGESARILTSQPASFVARQRKLHYLTDALEIIRPDGVTQAKYTDDNFDRPALHLQENRVFGGIFAMMGGLCVLGSLLWLLLTRVRSD